MKVKLPGLHSSPIGWIRMGGDFAWITSMMDSFAKRQPQSVSAAISPKPPVIPAKHHIQSSFQAATFPSLMFAPF